MNKKKPNARIVFKDGSSRDFIAIDGQSAFGCYHIRFINESGEQDSLSYQNCVIEMVIDLRANEVIHKPN